MFPSQRTDDSIDAIVVFAGGHGERYNKGLEMLAKHPDATLYISIGAEQWAGRKELMEACEPDRILDSFVCFQLPVTYDDTAGEAAAFAFLASQQGKKHLLVVSATVHLQRASLRINQCWPGLVSRVGIRGEQKLRYYIHEIGGIIEAMVLDRACRDIDNSVVGI